LRVIELLPTRLVGVIADHGDFPIERIAIDRAGEGRWVGSVGHDEALRLTDLREVLEDEDESGAKTEDEEGDASSDEGAEGAHSALPLARSRARNEDGGGEKDSGDEPDAPKPSKRRKKDKGDLTGWPQKKSRNQVDVDPSFFSGL